MSTAETDSPWRDKETLERLYVDEKLTQVEVADRLGCTKRTIVKWCKEHGIKTRKGRPPKPYAYFRTHELGYERWEDRSVSGRGHPVKVHRLAAVAWYGFDAVVGNHVHHKNGVPWDNREVNIELLSPSDHMKTHHEEGWDMRGSGNHNAKLDWDDVRRIRQCRGLVTAKELAEEFGVGRNHIYRIWKFEVWDPSDYGGDSERQ